MTTQINTKLQSIKLQSMDIVSQTELAFAHKLPLMIGASIGGLVPIGTFTVGHSEIADAGWLSVPGAIVAGGLLFSAITVYKWGERAFASGAKALGFVVLSEGIMSFSHTPWLSILMLSMLVLVNAIANGANLAMQYVETQANQAQDQAQDQAQVLRPSAVLSAAKIAAPVATSTPQGTPLPPPAYPTDRRWTPIGAIRAAPTPRARLRPQRLPTADLN
jgi:hypothetical protein